MTWWAVDVRVPEGRREPVGAWLVAHTGFGVEERTDGTLVSGADTEAAADALIRAVREAHDDAAASGRPLADVDWSSRWRDGLAARRFGRLTVTPSWIDGAAAGPHTVVIDPEMAFGSGEHGSTRAALTLLERHLVPGNLVLDLGSGSGILAIAAAALGAVRAIGVDNDADANVVAARNATRNGVAEGVTFIDGDAGELAPLLGPADLLLSNILRNVNTQLLPAIHAALRPGGRAIFSGMEAAEADLFLPDLSRAEFDPVDAIVDAGWWAVAARRR